MNLQHYPDLFIYNKGSSSFKFQRTGDVFELLQGGTMVNCYQGNCTEGSVNNIYLRVYGLNGELFTAPLLGIKSESKLYTSKNLLHYKGSFHGINYCVKFCLAEEGLWFWQVELSGQGRVDLLYGQDVGVGDKNGVLTNELYISQYLDHRVIEGENGYGICSRQNQSQGGRFPYLQQGMILGKAVAYSTDATQFYGLEYKGGALPKAYKSGLESRNYQFELSMTALQTQIFELKGESIEAVFYGLFKGDHPKASSELEDLEIIKQRYEQVDWKEPGIAAPEIALSEEIGQPFSSEGVTEAEINGYFPTRIEPEKGDDGTLLSFFTEEFSHVVLKEKELLTERPHGSIITTLLDDEHISEGLMTSTNYMYGIFNGQTVAGNTSMNKFLSTPRGLLNILKNTGQRIYVKLSGRYRLLTMPAMYEMGLNYSKWFYKIAEDMLIITVYAVSGASDIVLAAESKMGVQYDFLVTNQLVMGEQEFQRDIDFTQEGRVLTFRPWKKDWENNPYPDLQYRMILDRVAEIGGDGCFFKDGISRNGTLLTIKYDAVENFTLRIEGRVQGDNGTQSTPDFETEKGRYLEFYDKLSGHFRLSSKEGAVSELDRLNITVRWFTHNAMVHFAVPHGLEQPGGAAWGTRDVCQGPMEFLLATGHYTLAREVLLRIFQAQSKETGEWPQWFMFDKYAFAAGECHGDVVFWPLKCVADYVKTSGDAGFFSVEIMNGLKLALAAIKGRFLADTALISYAGGDWDDTLQPANKALAEYLVSAWTMALAYQTINSLGEVVPEEEFGSELREIAGRIRADFKKYLIKDGVIAGFAYCEDMNNIRYMLHPEDEETGIHCRLLPLTRSIIAEMIDLPQSKINVNLIEEKLKCPDGVRLMDNPAHYAGGVCKYFQRAEQAANVGREISLQYTHAHIRYVEAMAKIGSADNTWYGLLTVSPINIKKSVPRARLRQSNAYFSSSEGAFNDRYEYQNNFDMLRSGAIEVKGGWRIYSSGPGIYINQLITNVLGIRERSGCLEIDPVLPKTLDGMTFSFSVGGVMRQFVYHINEAGCGVSRVMEGGKELAGKALENPYRAGGLRISMEEMSSDEREIHIYIN